MRISDNIIDEITDFGRGEIPPHLLGSDKPVVLKGFVKHWPLAQKGLESPDAAQAYIKGFDSGEPVAAVYGDATLNGRLFYNDDMTAPNAQTLRVPMSHVFDKLSQHRKDSHPPLIYMASTPIDTYLLGFSTENNILIGNYEPLRTIWVGNKTRVAAHHDLPENIACVAVGKRRFTLFPPDQMENLYIGPLDVTPAGQAISLVDFHDIDYEKFPKFQAAQKAAMIAEMDPGDAIYIPSMWWHHVEALSDFNVLVNFWWRSAPAYMGPPINALQHALLAIKDLPAHEKAHWKMMFDHYVFDNTDTTHAHIPQASQGVLGPMDDTNARRVRAFLLNRLNR